MFLCHLNQKVLHPHNTFQKFSNMNLMFQNLKRHVMILLNFQLNYVGKSTNSFFDTVSSSYLKSYFLFYKIKHLKLFNEKSNLKFKQCICTFCGPLQYPKKDVNYFELFGIPQTFDIDVEVLSTKFKSLQMTYHPDKFINKAKVELEISESHSRLVNKAYATLKNPLERGFYLLELKNVPVNNFSPIGKDFLMSLMDKNEELEGITDKNELEEFKKKNNEEMKKQIHLISENFFHKNYDEARLNLLKLNYCLNLEMKIKGKENSLFYLEQK